MPKPTNSASRKRELERLYYMQHVTGMNFNPTTSFQTVARTYYLQYLNNAQFTSQTPLQSLFVAWAKKWIANNGGTPPKTNFESDLFRGLVIALGMTPSRNLNDNYITFFSNAA